MVTCNTLALHKIPKFHLIPKIGNFGTLRSVERKQGQEDQGIQECLGRPYHSKFFKGCLPQIFLDLFIYKQTDSYILGHMNMLASEYKTPTYVRCIRRIKHQAQYRTKSD